MAKKLLIAGTVLVLVAALGWVVLSGSLGRLKRNAEAWCARQLLAIAADHLNPTLHFDRLVYTFPRSVRLTGVTLTDGDAVVISADAISIDFADIPRRGRPVVLQELELLRPTVRLIVRPDGSLAGLSDLVKSGGGSVRPDGGSTRLSDVLNITTIDLVEGALSYEPPDRPAMVLRPLTFELRKRAGAAARPGWYAFEASSTLEPVAHVTTRSRLNLDNGDLDLESFTLDMMLDESQYQVFPPDIQQLLRDHQVVGELRHSMQGLIGLGDLSRTSLEFDVDLTDARAVIGGHEIPIESLVLDGTFHDSVLDVPRLTGTAFAGQVDAAVHVDYGADDSPFEVTLEAVDLRLEDAMAYDGMPSEEYTGDVTIRAGVSGRMADLAGSISGGGEATVENGRIVLVELFRRELKERGEHGATDRAELTFELHGDRISYPEGVIVGNLIGIRGRGDMYYDGRMNFVVSAGPIERLTGDTGPVREFLGGVAGSLVKYQVTGTLDDTKVKVLPLGIGEKKEPAANGESQDSTR